MVNLATVLQQVKVQEARNLTAVNRLVKQAKCPGIFLERSTARLLINHPFLLGSRGVHGNGEDWDPMGFPWEWE